MSRNRKIGTFAKGGALGATTAGFALLASLAAGSAFASDSADVARPILDFVQFTPASIDPVEAARVSQQLRAGGVATRFTPARTETSGERTVTVAVRVDEATAKVFERRRSSTSGIPDTVGTGGATRIAALQPSTYNLGIARGYKSFARPAQLPDSVRKIEGMPDLSEFRPDSGTDRPGRLQPRISLEQERQAGRSPRTIEDASDQSVDVGGSYRVTRNIDVTAGVRVSQERNRIVPDEAQDNQAVYVGTQFRF
ncbi:hypothetical protein [Qipengyuania sp. JC766]|uniref:hypothetical protein n=1 Tax=Qipengyuania sp. JC766 TaxID=3232139 RepID=UPI00345A8E1D